ncbi:MAG: hypothetical protein JJE25_13260 [Bacteroidia bacterium]|nr:hypothetical protein [Bacteroidia bacterium]
MLKKIYGINTASNAMTENEDAIKSVQDDMSKNKDGVKSVQDDIPKNMHGIKSVQDDMPQNMDGIKSVRDDMYKNKDGIKSVQDDMPKNMHGIKSARGDVAENMDGINTGFYDVSEIEQRIKTIVYGMPENAAPPLPAPSPVRKIAPKHITVDDDAIVSLSFYLRKVFHVRTSEGKLLNVAKELLFLHNHGKGLGHDLRREARLSKPGFAKHLPTLHRHGLIKRGEKKFYHLTDFSKQLIDKIFGE